MRLEIVRRGPGELVLTVLGEGDAVLWTSVPHPTRAAIGRAIEALVRRLRAGEGELRRTSPSAFRVLVRDEAGSPLGEGESRPRAAAEATLAELQAWARAGTRFEALRVRPPRAHAALRYALEEESRTGLPGVELLRRGLDDLYCVHLNDERGRPLLFSPGFPAARARDQALDAILRAAVDPRLYRREDARGRNGFVLVARNGRELARGRTFPSGKARDAAIELLVRVAAEELARREPAAPRAVEAGEPGPDERVGPPGLELLDGVEGRWSFRVNDESGRALLASRGYASARQRDLGLAALRRVVGEQGLSLVAAEGGAAILVRARNGRELARSRVFVGRDEAEGALAVLRRLLGEGDTATPRVAPQVVEVPFDDEVVGAELAQAFTAEEDDADEDEPLGFTGPQEAEPAVGLVATPILSVSSVAASVRWFEALGWSFAHGYTDAGTRVRPQERTDAWAGVFAVLRAGRGQLFLCERGQGGRARAPEAGAERGGAFWTYWSLARPEDVDAMHERALAAGHLVLAPPRDQPWGERELRLAHPDGHVFRISSRLA